MIEQEGLQPKACINLNDFPALPTEKDDRGRLMRAIKATPVGGELIIPPGHYLADSLVIDKSISLLFQGEATLEATAPNRDILRIEGVRDKENFVLDKPVKRGDRVLQLKTTASFAPGDVIILTDDTARARDKQQDMNTEIHEIQQVIHTHSNLFQEQESQLRHKGIAVGWHPRGKGEFDYDPAAGVQKIIVAANQSNPCRAGLTQAIPIQRDENYTFFIEGKIDYTEEDFTGTCYLRWYSTKGKMLLEQPITDFSSASWVQVEKRNLSPPPDAAFCQFYVEGVTSSSFSQGILYIRNWKMSLARTQIVLRDFVRLPKAVSQKGINLYKMTPLEQIRVQNFRFLLKEGSTSGSGLILRYVRGAVIENINGCRLAGSGIQVQKALQVVVRGFRFSEPQCTGSGQGYGVQFFGGCSGIIIRDGFTFDLRHAVDLDSTYDAHVEHVFDYNSTGAAFVMSHNGCCSDISFYQCQTLYTQGTGFVADSQGFADPRDCTFYHFQVIGCTALIRNRATAAVYWYSPCQGAIVRDCRLAYDTGQHPQHQDLGNAGIRLYPARTEAQIQSCEITGFRRGIATQTADNRQLSNDHSRITVRDITIKNCQSAILCHQGLHRRLAIFHLDGHQIGQYLFEMNGEFTFDELVLDGISLYDSPACQLASRQPSFPPAKGGSVRGYVSHLSSDQSLVPSISRHWQLSPLQLYFSLSGSVFHLPGTGAVSARHPLPDGLVEGQLLTLTTSQGVWTIHCGANMALHQRKVTLNHHRRSLSLLWKDGKWIEI